ncbi:SDR family NAD(P)-dependent oxidoreductase [Thiomonas sp. FB-6]|uniref:SDR family NAD(P)-dependent oxidoreductase n=1 Tax=Thiomonas sp. FB-6 TaxID=1158291 RepID=UPI0003AA9D57|nr:SDR family oxidoreductase [Thiomonas sp. FB-6]
MTRSKQPVCMITGAATGIGAATALRFAQGGWSVAIGHFGADTREAALGVEARCREAGAGTLVFEADVRDDAACRAAVATAEARWGRLDSLVNCAGTTRVIPHRALESIDAAEFERVYGVNAIGLFQMTRAAAPLLERSASPEASSSVVNVSSLAGLNGTGSSLAYAASKGAVNTMTLSLARSLAPRVRVNAVAPGMVDDGLLQRCLDPRSYAGVLERMTRQAALRRVSRPAEVAEIAWFLATQAPALTGQVLCAENGLLLAEPSPGDSST